ncbi:HB2L protein, partial [Bucco capensis]|nr:HB2L protein [Bucco capensis]
VLLALVLLGAQLGAGQETSGVFLFLYKSECHFLNGTERVRFLEKYIYNREQYAHFDSEVGLYVADTALGEISAKKWNSQADLLEDRRSRVDICCRQNYRVVTPVTVERRGE